MTSDVALAGGWDTARRRLRTAEAAALLAVGSAAQRWVPLPRWAPALGVASPVPDDLAGVPVSAAPVAPVTRPEREVRRAVQRASARLPWQPTCLAQAFAGQVMLRRRRYPGIVVIGLRPTAPGRAWDVHAWLSGPTGTISGGVAARGFTPTMLFRPPGGLGRGIRPAPRG